MAYKKPQILAKSAAKQSFVAGCPGWGHSGLSCGVVRRECVVTGVK